MQRFLGLLAALAAATAAVFALAGQAGGKPSSWRAIQLTPSPTRSDAPAAHAVLRSPSANAPLVHIAPGNSPAGYIPLSVFGVAPVPIGDENILNFNVPAFVFNGATHTTIGVDPNGYIVVGGGSSEDNVCCSPVVGDPARPNGVLAPFWTDLDGTGAPGIGATVLTDGVKSWLVVEWAVNVFGTSSVRTFQVWIGLNGVEDISYAYDPANLPADPGQPLVVGVENRDGTSGASITGLPNQDLVVTSNSPPSATDDSYSTNQNAALSVSAPGVLGNDSDPDGNPISAVLVTGPSHGSLTLNTDGSFTYTPTSGYSGPESFTYRAKDSANDTSSAATVSITVISLAPSVTVAAGGSCGADDRTGTLALMLTDADTPLGSLTLSGSSSNTALVPNANLSFSGSGGSRALRITTVSGKTASATITVTVSDGTQTGAVTITVRAGGNGNSALAGTTGTDLLLGQNGDDTPNGEAGNDVLCGGRGSDTLTGGPGADHFSGGQGPDTATDLTAADGDTQDGTVP